MKKQMLIIVSCLICLSMLTACGKASPTETPDANPAVSDPKDSAATVTETQGKMISPLPSTIHMDALDNCSVAAGFEAKDVYLEGGSRLVIRMTVYDSELFDAVDIAALKKGDTLVLGGENIKVASVEDNGNGLLSINGGYESGGVWLATADTGVYYEVRENEARTYYPVGEATLPVAQEFVFRDSSDPEQAEKIRYAGDLITDMSGSDRVFSPNATTVTISEGAITELTTIFVP